MSIFEITLERDFTVQVQENLNVNSYSEDTDTVKNSIPRSSDS